MTTNGDHPKSGRASKENPNENQVQPGEYGELEARRREFNEKRAEGSANVDQAAREAARRLGEGFLIGLGKRFAEKVWDVVSDQLGS